MNNNQKSKVAIFDYGLGNLFSIKHACNYAGMEPFIISSAHRLMEADLIILPGVGAFGDAMESLRRLDLISPLHDIVDSGKLLMGICLGMQLLMSESHEFGNHKGLDIIKGEVVKFDKPLDTNGKTLKVPHVSWNKIYLTDKQHKIFQNLNDETYMYFVHSFYVKPDNVSNIIFNTYYGNIEFCSGILYNNIFACQFHPERSGPKGLSIYKNLDSIIRSKKQIF